jgi:hypothetical protein
MQEGTQFCKLYDWRREYMPMKVLKVQLFVLTEILNTIGEKTLIFKCLEL